MTPTECLERVDAIFDRGSSNTRWPSQARKGWCSSWARARISGLPIKGRSSPTSPHKTCRWLSNEWRRSRPRHWTLPQPSTLPTRLLISTLSSSGELPIVELAARAGIAADWYELFESPEMAAYRNALAADNQVCAEFQAGNRSLAHPPTSSPRRPAEWVATESRLSPTKTERAQQRCQKGPRRESVCVRPAPRCRF